MVTLDTKPDSELTSSRKRFARRQWARRWLAWRRVAVALLALLIVGGGVYAVYFSSWLEVDGVEVRGTVDLTSADIATAAEVPVGEPLAKVDLEAIERKVMSLGAVRSVEVSRQWPHEVLIEIEERVPVAVVKMGDLLRNLDADGVVFGDRKRPPGNLPMVETSSDVGDDALREAATVAAALEPAVPGDRRPPRGRDRRPDHAGAARRPEGAVGQRRAVGGEGRGACRPALPRGPGLRRQRARLADDQPQLSDPPADCRSAVAACRRQERRGPAYCRDHDEVDITITLRLRVTVLRIADFPALEHRAARTPLDTERPQT